MLSRHGGSRNRKIDFSSERRVLTRRGYEMRPRGLKPALVWELYAALEAPLFHGAANVPRGARAFDGAANVPRGAWAFDGAPNVPPVPRPNGTPNAPRLPAFWRCPEHSSRCAGIRRCSVLLRALLQEPCEAALHRNLCRRRRRVFECGTSHR